MLPLAIQIPFLDKRVFLKGGRSHNDGRANSCHGGSLHK